MKVKALKSFSGALSMYKGEVRECAAGETLSDLLKCGYIEEVKTPKRRTERNENK